jgi:hypothetical protein
MSARDVALFARYRRDRDPVIKLRLDRKIAASPASPRCTSPD